MHYQAQCHYRTYNGYLKNYQNIRQKCRRKARHDWKMLQALYEISIAPCWRSLKWNQQVDRNGAFNASPPGQCLHWSTSRTKSSSQRRFTSTYYYDLHQSSSANYGGIQLQSLPVISRADTNEHPLTSMVAWRTGGSKKTPRSLYHSDSRSSISLKRTRTLTVPRSTGSRPFYNSKREPRWYHCGP